jgi:Zn-dependent protease
MSQSPPRAPGRGQRGILIARVAGIPVSIGTSWLFLAAALVFLVGTSNPGLGATAYGVGAAYALGLLVAVLVHEAAHAVAARSFGIVVHRIVADLWGGHTAFDGRRTTPGRSAVIAVSGPLANLVLAALGYAAGSGVPSGTIPAAIIGAFAWVNLLLAAFNLLPGLPLDGGQLVDSLVWWASGRRDLGLVAGGWSGRVVTLLVAGYLLVLPVVRGEVPGTGSIVWTLLIGMFMWRGATSAIQTGRARRVISAVRVRDVIVPAVLVEATAPIGGLGQVGGVHVAHDDSGRPTLVGVQLDTGEAPPPPQTPIEATMVRIPDESVVECGPDEDITELIAAIQTTQVGVTVVTSGGRPYGVATTDAINARLEAAAGS